MKRSIWILAILATGATLAGTDVTLLGPADYEAPGGSPVTYVDEFPGEPGVARIVVTNGDSSGDRRVTRGRIQVNGQTIFRGRDLRRNSVLEAEVPVDAVNSLRVRLKGKGSDHDEDEDEDGDEGVDRPLPLVTVTITQVVEASAGGVVDVDGGTVSVDDPASPLSGYAVEFPAGSLAGPTLVSIGPGTPPDIPEGFFLGGAAADIETSSPLAGPARVTIPFAPASVPGGVLLGAFHFDDDTSEWSFLLPRALDPVAGLLTVEVDGFSLVDYGWVELLEILTDPAVRSVAELELSISLGSDPWSLVTAPQPDTDDRLDAMRDDLGTTAACSTARDAEAALAESAADALALLESGYEGPPVATCDLVFGPCGTIGETMWGAGSPGGGSEVLASATAEQIEAALQTIDPTGAGVTFAQASIFDLCMSCYAGQADGLDDEFWTQLGIYQGSSYAAAVAARIQEEECDSAWSLRFPTRRIRVTTIDDDENIYVAETFGPGGPQITKLSPEGEPLWNKALTGLEDVNLFRMIVRDDRLFLSGWSDVEAVQDPFFPNVLLGANFVVELDLEGVVRWSREFLSPDGFLSVIAAPQILALPSGDLLLSISSSAGIFGSSGTVIRLDDAGEILWARSNSQWPIFDIWERTDAPGFLVSTEFAFEEWSEDGVLESGFNVQAPGSPPMGSRSPRHLEFTDDGGSVLGGTAVDASGEFAWVVKLDAEREIEWERAFDIRTASGLDADVFSRDASIREAADGGFAFTGLFPTSVDPETLRVEGETWMTKLAANGEIEWQRRYRERGPFPFGQLDSLPSGGFLVGRYSEALGAGTLMKLDELGRIPESCPFIEDASVATVPIQSVVTELNLPPMFDPYVDVEIEVREPSAVTIDTPLFTAFECPVADVARWDFNEDTGDTAIDVTGNGNDGTIEGAVRVPGFLDGAISLDGLDDRVSVPHDDRQNLFANAITLEALVRVDDVPFTELTPLVVKGDPAAGEGYALYLAFGRPVFSVGGSAFYRPGDCDADVGGCPEAGPVVGSILTPGEWHHIAGIFDGNEAWLVVDGAVPARGLCNREDDPTDPDAVPGPPGCPGGPVASTADIAIGGMGAPENTLTGLIDEVRITNQSSFPTPLFDRGRCEFDFQPFDGGWTEIVPSPGSGALVTDPCTGQIFFDTDPGNGDGLLDACYCFDGPAQP